MTSCNCKNDSDHVHSGYEIQLYHLETWTQKVKFYDTCENLYEQYSFNVTTHPNFPINYTPNRTAFMVEVLPPFQTNSPIMQSFGSTDRTLESSVQLHR